MRTAIEAVKNELANSDFITVNMSNEYIGWDQYGTIVITSKDKNEVVNKLFEIFYL